MTSHSEQNEFEATFAQRGAAAVLEARPNLSFRSEAGAATGLPELVLDSPAPGRQLRIYFDNGEFTVSFEQWHRHSDHVDEALEVVDTIVSGIKVVVVAMSVGSDQWQGSDLVDAGDEDAWLDFITTPRPHALTPLRFIRVSWNGGDDRKS